jgi:putative ABC transport system permease protein
MIVTENINVALKSIWSNKMRSLLTTLGIIIGVMAVIGVVSIIQGFSHAINDFFQSMGSTVMWVSFYRPPGEKGEKLGDVELTYDDVMAIPQYCPSVESVSPIIFKGNADVKYLDTSMKTTMMGTTPEFQQNRNFFVEKGRFFSEVDMELRKNVCVIGYDILEKLELTDSIVGDYIKIDGWRFKVIGILEKKGNILDDSQDDLVLIPIQTAAQMLGKNSLKYVFSFVKCSSPDLVNEAKAQITLLLRRRHELTPDLPDDFRVETGDELLKKFNEITNGLTMVMGGIVGIALLVGGIGIMNIMLVSVTERTREIGIRKAVGARKRDIMLQFLIESVTLSVVGGIVGIFLGFIVGAIGNHFLRKLLEFLPNIYVPIWAILLSFGFAAGVGIIFGTYPAIKAAKQDPIEALRYE